jgi:rSAM/selenodomain-associated transferase 1
MPWSNVTFRGNVGKLVDPVAPNMSRQATPLTGPTLGIFAKQPVPGQVKTRLCPPLQLEEACRLYRVALQETITRLSHLLPTTVLCHTASAAWFGYHYPDMPLLSQGDGHLGHRLQRVCDALFDDGGRPLLIIGTDSPDLPLDLVEAAAAALVESDLVTIPARDGGYALIGLRTPQPEIFEDIPWSTANVLQATRQRAKVLQLVYKEIGTWDDLDDLPALLRLMERSPESATASFIRTEFGYLL